MSDILSYSRILALSMSSGVIALVMNLLAQMVQGDLSTFSFMTIIKLLMAMVVYFVGHVFNLAMGLLSAYVHASRLQYIEFFGKFYEGSGYAFTPLENKLTYIDELNVN
jgi:V/A-type H+-transporting ATPase subunit I